MSNNSSANSGGVKTYKPQDFGRKLSGRKILLILAVMALIMFVAVELFKQLRWSAYLNRVEPRESFALIIKDLRKFQKRSKELPIDLSLGAKQKWNWAKELQISSNKISQNEKIVTKFRHRQYEYLYARINENTAVLWAVPLWIEIKPEPWWIDMYTGHNEAIKNFYEQWKKEKDVWFIVLHKDRTRAWHGNFAPQPSATTGLEGFLEPTGEWLQHKSLKETKAEKWIQ